MKFKELHRMIRQAGWILLPGKGKGSHKIYQKDGKKYTVPYHSSKGIDNSFARLILKEMGII